MTTYNAGDVALVPFPFTDQSTSKKRPSVVISVNKYNQGLDVIIMAVTSQSTLGNVFGEVIIKNWKEAGLLKKSVIKPVITTIEKKLILKKLGTLNQEDQSALQTTLEKILFLKYKPVPSKNKNI